MCINNLLQKLLHVQLWVQNSFSSYSLLVVCFFDLANRTWKCVVCCIDVCKVPTHTLLGGFFLIFPNFLPNLVMALSMHQSALCYDATATNHRAGYPTLPLRHAMPANCIFLNCSSSIRVRATNLESYPPTFTHMSSRTPVIRVPLPLFIYV